MRRLIYLLIPVVFVLFACNLQTATISPPPQGSATPTVAEAQPTDTPTVAPAPTATPNVTCNNLTLNLDQNLAANFQCKTVPAAGGPDDPYFAVNPQYTEVTLQGYVLPNTFFAAHIDVYPVQDFQTLLPDAITPRVTELQQLIAGGALPAKGALPLLPVFNAAEELHVLYQVIPFSSGNGIRYLTQYAQFFDPINSHDLFYSFQGLTTDGKYWISAILPISNSILPPNGDNPPGGLTWDQFSAQYVTYLADITTKLTNQPPDSYAPTVAALDALINGIAIQP